MRRVRDRQVNRSDLSAINNRSKFGHADRSTGLSVGPHFRHYSACSTGIPSDEMIHSVNDTWNIDEANRLVRNALVEIDAVAEQIIPARAEALLDEFERDIRDGFLLKSIAVVKATCEEYGRRFQALVADK
jgi:hypothetical protein